MRLFTGLLTCKCSEVNSAPHFWGFAKASVLKPILNITALWGVRGIPPQKGKLSDQKKIDFVHDGIIKMRERAPRDPSQVGPFHILKVR